MLVYSTWFLIDSEPCGAHSFSVVTTAVFGTVVVIVDFIIRGVSYVANVPFDESGVYLGMGMVTLILMISMGMFV